MDMSLLQTKMKPATPLPELQTVEDIYRWIDENIAYGWQDKDGGTHTSEMKDFRRLYRTMSVTETLRQKIGTCIEQVALMHELLDAIGIPEEELRHAAQLSVCKINIDSDIRLAITASIREHFAEHPDHFDPRQYLKPARQAVKDMVTHKLINVLGCNGKA